MTNLHAIFLRSRYGSKNLYILVSGVARRLLSEETRREAFASMQQLADIVGPKQFHSYIDKASWYWRSKFGRICAKILSKLKFWW